jgi:hypothetical protein
MTTTNWINSLPLPRKSPVPVMRNAAFSAYFAAERSTRT